MAILISGPGGSEVRILSPRPFFLIPYQQLRRVFQTVAFVDSRYIRYNLRQFETEAALLSPLLS